MGLCLIEDIKIHYIMLDQLSQVLNYRGVGSGFSAVDSSQTPPDTNICDNSPCGQKCMHYFILQGRFF